MMQQIRNYQANDYEAVIALYKTGELYGGQFDEARDAHEKLLEVTRHDPESILVYEVDGEIVGTISLIENGRVAWLFRFAVKETEDNHDIAKALYDHAKNIFKSRGHTQILVYSDPKNQNLNGRYAALGMTEGSLYRCFWEEV